MTGRPECAEGPCPAPPMPGSRRCYFHDKKARGLFSHTCDTLCEINRIERGLERCPRVWQPSERHHVRESGVLDDEQREIADVLELMGTPTHEIKAAIMKRRQEVGR